MTADVQRELAEARQMLLVHDALYNLIVDHPMWIDGKGRGLHYSPKREALIGDFLDSAVEMLGPVIADAEKRAAAAAVTLNRLAPRFWSRVDVGPPTECWPWTGSTVGIGHGRYDSPAGGTAHRLAWALGTGELPPAGMVVRHSCDNPPCCNPDHLALGTQADNVQDMVDRGRASWSTPECRSGHPRTPENTIFRGDGHARCLACTRDAQDRRRESYVVYRCPECSGQAKLYSLVRHLRVQHGRIWSAQDVRARAAALDPAGAASGETT